MSTLSSALSLAVLILLLLLVTSNEGATGGGVCTEGFMDLSLLVAKAAPATPSTVNPFANSNFARRWVIAGGNAFNCSTAAVTEVLLGVDIRSKDGNRNKYPSIEIWQYYSNQQPRNYQERASIPIVLSPDNVTTNGLYHYVLPTPFSVSSSVYRNYRLGVYQPEDDSSVVRLYRATASSTETVGVIKADSIVGDSYIRTSGWGREIDFYNNVRNIFMVHVKTDPLNCFENFFTETKINTNSLSVTNVIPVNDTRAFPDIQFTCNGIITNWIIGITQNQDTSKHYPNIYLKRSSELIHALTVDASAATSSNGNVYNFTSDIEVEYGDILVINVTTNSNPMYYQQYNGPLNYELDSSNGLIPLEHNDYPLISAIIIKPIPSVTEMSSSTATEGINTVATMTMLSSSTTTTDIVMRPNSIPTSAEVIHHSTSLHYTTTLSLLSTTSLFPTNALSSSDTTSVTKALSSSATGTTTSLISSSSVPSSSSSIVIITPSHTLSITESITTPLSSIESSRSAKVSRTQNTVSRGNPTSEVLVTSKKSSSNFISESSVTRSTYKRRNKAKLIIGGHDTCLVNTYSDIAPNGKEDKELKGPIVYEEAKPVMNGTETVYGDTMIDSTLINVINPTYGAPENGIGASSVYEEPSAAVNRKQKDIEFSNELYGLLEEATLYVPTAKKRSGGESEEIYSTLMNELYSSTYSRLDHTGGNAFFIEDTEYWEPDSNTDGIYQQLSDRKYREIIRHQIKVTDYLGSGQFGTVNKGVWTTPTAGSVSVAIKTLNDNTSEDERVKFLQEAAIMGQFHHPNVVKLHGVVTIGHPIMIVLELISGGDLKEYLNKFKPSPGELVLSSVPSILLSFCRQIASGMEYLSRKKFVHRDLAARNILVSDEGTGICKIADFGMSRDLQDESYYISQAKKIPIKWTAPEALHYKKYLSASDVWSYGAVMYEIWSIGHKPFEKDTNQECIRLVDSGYRLPPPPGCPKPMYKLMMQCWNPDTHNRPSFSDISSSLSSPDKQLLMINREDPVTVLGGALETSHSLYTDLQYMYKN
uniref:Protein kinase domain-containing protein n=1 Tax=Amphimedon queenslandica TaxID=400682 RepID=A0A1X7TRF4_AMPQE